MDFKLIYLARRNPAIPLAEWPRAWRSHAVFASQFPVIGGRITSLFYCSRMTGPTLDGAPFAPPGLALDYDGVAVVSSPSAEDLGGELSAADRARIDQDELRVFDAQTPSFSFRCQETLVHGGAPGQAAVIRFLARKSGDTREAFQSRWSQRHAEVATHAVDAAATVTRYVHDDLVEPPPPGYPFDGVTETWFATPDDAVRALAGGALEPVAEDLAAFCDLERSITLLTHVIHRWPRA